MLRNRGLLLLIDLNYNRTTPIPSTPPPLFTTGCQRSAISSQWSVVGGGPSAVSLKVYNVLGLKVATLVDGEQRVGYKSFRWDASSFSSGIYFCRLEVKGDGLKVVKTRKMVLLR